MQGYHKKKDYQCPTCKKWYREEEKLDKHMEEAHGANQQICDVWETDLLKRLSQDPPKEAQIKVGNL